MIPGETSEPTLNDFYNDMNSHGNADYKRVGGRNVVELDSQPSGWVVTVWRAVRHPHRDAYARPNNSANGYAWDAVGRQEFEHLSDAESAFAALSGKGDISEFCDEHPYDGPRTPGQDVAE